MKIKCNDNDVAFTMNKLKNEEKYENKIHTHSDDHHYKHISKWYEEYQN